MKGILIKNKNIVPRSICILLVVLGILSACVPSPKGIDKTIEDYVETWKDFYPTQAFSSGDLDSAFVFKEITLERIGAWIDFNHMILEKLQLSAGEMTLDDRIDSDLLERQILGELERWEKDKVFENSPLFYAGQISQALTHILARDELSPTQKRKAVLNRLSGIQSLCAQGEALLKNGRPHNTLRSLVVMASSARFFEENLIEISLKWPNEPGLESFPEECRNTAASVRSLIAYIREDVTPQVTLSDSLGYEAYARKLKIYTGSDMTPEELEEIAFQEIKEVQTLMESAAREYWGERYPREKSPEDFKELMKRVLQDMEANREENQKGFLDVFCSIDRPGGSLYPRSKHCHSPQGKDTEKQRFPRLTLPVRLLAVSILRGPLIPAPRPCFIFPQCLMMHRKR